MWYHTDINRQGVQVVVRMVDVRVVFGLDECNCDKYKYIGAHGNSMTEKESNEAHWGNIMRE